MVEIESINKKQEKKEAIEKQEEEEEAIEKQEEEEEAIEEEEEEEEISIEEQIIKSKAPIPESISPVFKTIKVLQKKYGDVNFDEIALDFQNTARKLQELNEKMREISVLKNYEKMTVNQKLLHDEVDENLKFFKEKSEEKNIIVLIFGDKEKLPNKSEKGYSFGFFKSIIEASDFCDTKLSEDETLNTFVSPLFISV